MAQIKEQNKTPEKEVNEMEISILSDAEFKTLFISMLEELIGYLNSVKRIQAEMKVALSKIKKNVHGINNGGDKAMTEINDLNIRRKKAFNQNSKKKKEFKKTRIG